VHVLSPEMGSAFSKKKKEKKTMERDKMNRRLSVAGVYKCLCACLLPSSFSFASDVH